MWYNFLIIYSNDIRKKVVEFVEDGGTKSASVRKFDVSIRTVFYWFSREHLEPTKILSRNGKINKQELIQHVENFPDIILRERAEHFGVNINAIWGSLRRLKIRKKKRLGTLSGMYTKGGGFSGHGIKYFQKPQKISFIVI